MELQAKSLRNGNLVMVNNPVHHPNLKGVVLEVTGINETVNRSRFTHTVSLKHINQKPNTYYETYSQFIEYVEPILLTEEILIKAGFEKEHYEYPFPNGSDKFELNEEFCLYGAGAGFQFFVEDEINTNTIDVVFKYLHKLQNFYFELKEKELEIKL